MSTHGGSGSSLFRTGLFTPVGVPGERQPPFKGAGWVITTQHEVGPRGGVTIGNTLYRNVQIVISAKSWWRAQHALWLLQACFPLVAGSSPFWNPSEMIAHNERHPDWMDPVQRKDLACRRVSSGNLLSSCYIASRMSRRKRYVHALAKLGLSLSTFSSPIWELDPARAVEHLGVSVFPSDYIAYAYAIILAYSAVEDLGLEVRASKMRPSRIQGKWNPPVLNDLQARLTKAGIDGDKDMLWHDRGPKRRLRGLRDSVISRPAPWAHGQNKDKLIKVVDAIAEVSWLRSKVSSHGVSQLTPSLNPYDVANAQQLARVLLLSSVRCFPPR